MSSGKPGDVSCNMLVSTSMGHQLEPEACRESTPVSFRGHVLCAVVQYLYKLAGLAGCTVLGVNRFVPGGTQRLAGGWLSALSLFLNLVKLSLCRHVAA